jgi:hypothetical protein
MNTTRTYPDALLTPARRTEIAAWFVNNESERIMFEAAGTVLFHALLNGDLIAAIDAVGDAQVGLGIHRTNADDAFLTAIYVELSAIVLPA